MTPPPLSMSRMSPFVLKAVITQSNPRDSSRKSASPHERSRRRRPFYRKTRPNHTVSRGIKGDARVIRKELALLLSFSLSLTLFFFSPPPLSRFEAQNFPSAEEPAAGWAGWAQRGRFHRSICQLVLLPYSCQITRPIPS